MGQIKDFRGFWTYYLQEHARPVTRGLHYAGTGLALLILAAAPVTRTWALAAAAPVAGYGVAWLAHRYVERNRPATFGHPLWSLRADYKMLFCFLTGGMRRELADAGVRPDGSVDPAKRCTV